MKSCCANACKFNGLIVSDATGMAGLGAWGPRRQTLPEVIANGCDVILFANDARDRPRLHRAPRSPTGSPPNGSTRR